MISILDKKIADAGFYINLKTSADRKERVLNQIEKYNIIGLERFEALTDPYHQFSCTKSHLSVFQYCLDNNIESVLILEDDFQIYDDCKFMDKKISFSECLDNIIEDMNNVEWDVILLGCNPKTYLIPVTNNLSINSNSTGGWAYIIKKRAYEYILKNSNYHSDLIAIDDYLPMLNKKGFISLATIPLVIHHGVDLISTLQPREPVNYDAMIEGNYYNYIYNFTDNQENMYNLYEIERNLTIVIKGNFIENYLHYLRYLLLSLPKQLEKCRFIIIYDTINNTVNYERIRELLYYFYNRVKPINYDIRLSNDSTTDFKKIMLELVKTKYFLLLQQDWVFLDKDKLNFDDLINCMNKYDFVNSIGFNNLNNDTMPYEKEERIEDFKLIKKSYLSDEPVLFRTSKYNEWFENDNVSGTYMYGDINDGMFIGHTDDTKEFQDSKKTITEYNGDEYMKNNLLPLYD